MVIVAGTGHRSLNKADLAWSRDAAKRALDLLCAEDPGCDIQVASGMARGFDLALAELALAFGYPLVAVLPHPDQTARWTVKDQRRYQAILGEASSVVCCWETVEAQRTWHSDKAQINWLIHHRNRMLVDMSVAVIACYDGRVTPSGTRYTYSYAEQTGKRIFRLNPATRTTAQLRPKAVVRC